MKKPIDLFLDKTQTRQDINIPVHPEDNYIYRYGKFSNLTLYEFTSQVYRGKRKEGENIDTLTLKIELKQQNLSKKELI